TAPRACSRSARRPSRSRARRRARPPLRAGLSRATTAPFLYHPAPSPRAAAGERSAATAMSEESTLLARLSERVLAGEALSPAEGLALYRGIDLPSLGLLADQVRQRINPGDIVTYIVDRNVNPTNVCVTDCGFCAFYRSPGHAEAYVLPREVIYRKIEEMLAQGGTQLLLQGGHHPHLKTARFAELFADIKRRYPQVWIHGMSPPEITHLGKLEKRSVRSVLEELHAAGLDSLPGGGAEILVDEVRAVIA